MIEVFPWTTWERLGFVEMCTVRPVFFSPSSMVAVSEFAIARFPPRETNTSTSPRAMACIASVES